MALDKKLLRNGPYADFFSQGVQVGNTLHMAGQVGTDATGQAPESFQRRRLTYVVIIMVLRGTGRTRRCVHSTRRPTKGDCAGISLVLSSRFVKISSLIQFRVLAE